MYEYNCNIVKVVDGDTVDVDIDLGFGMWLKNKRIRSFGPQEFCTKELFEHITQNNLLIDHEKKVSEIKKIIFYSLCCIFIFYFN